MIQLTESAVWKLQKLLQGKEGQGLRIKVVGGGCSGLQYKLDVTEPREGDRVFEQEGVRVFADRKSFLYVRGTEVDYQESLMEAGFRLNNPNVRQTCGCGTSFAV